MKKICVIGNSCSGKTTLSRKIAFMTELPLYHVDAIQFLPGLILRNQNETRKILSDILETESWIIDGIGPLNILEKRMQSSELIIVIKLSLMRIYWWCFKRQLKGIFFQRKELPEDCFESTIPQTIKLIKTIWNVQHGFWPQIERILQKDTYKGKVLFCKSPADLDSITLNKLSK